MKKINKPYSKNRPVSVRQTRNTSSLRNRTDSPSGHQTKRPAPVQKKTTVNRAWLFRLIAVLLPVAGLALIEIMLRLTGYGDNLDLFREYEQDNRFLTMNEAVSKRYFASDDEATVGFDDIFKKGKAAGTKRIFVLGESTTVGFPYTNNGSFDRWLRYRLMHSYPDTDFEIINLALTAVNSYTVYDFAREIVRYEPDAVLIYAGHNEYYGALGIGSTTRMGSSVHLVRLQITLRRLRLIQLVYNTLRRSGKDRLVADARQDPGMMIRMAGDYYISYGTKKYAKGVRQFETNMDDVCRILSRKNIPVFISNLVSNERDMKPFISDTTDNENNASRQFEQAEEAYYSGDYKKAKELYIKAKDLDMLRFRAPEVFNAIIKEMCSRYPGIYLVDAKSLFEQHSPSGIIGKETITEHIHPNLFGYALLSQAFFNVLQQQGFLPLDQAAMTFGQLMEQMPLSRFDSLKGAYTVELLLRNWPFNLTGKGEVQVENSLEGKLAYAVANGDMHWYNALAELSQHYEERSDWQEALKMAELSVLEFPYNESTYLYAARTSQSAGDKAKAAFYYTRAFRLKPDATTAQNAMALQMQLDRPELALPFADYLVEINPDNEDNLTRQQVINEMIAYKTALKADTANIMILNLISTMYLQMQNKEMALKYIAKALDADPASRESRKILDQIQQLPE